MFVRPWTVEISMDRTEGPLFEVACHEGNYGMFNILSGHRAEEKAGAGHEEAENTVSTQSTKTRGRTEATARAVTGAAVPASAGAGIEASCDHKRAIWALAIARSIPAAQRGAQPLCVLRDLCDLRVKAFSSEVSEECR